VTLPLDFREPGGREPAPDPELHLLQRFVNTNDIEAERDEIGTPARLHEWLVAAGVVVDGGVSDEGHARAIDVREGLRALASANNGESLDTKRLERFNAAATRLPMVAAVAPLEEWRLGPASGGVDGFLARLVATLVRAMADGSWSRVKACRSDTCRWLFFDQSRNRSGTWCSMAICGSRMKARAYRARRRPDGGRARGTRPEQVAG
jgi:predicted RNA-binding Zn ribbon-like protein